MKKARSLLLDLRFDQPLVLPDLSLVPAISRRLSEDDTSGEPGVYVLSEKGDIVGLQLGQEFIEFGDVPTVLRSLCKYRRVVLANGKAARKGYYFLKGVARSAAITFLDVGKMEIGSYIVERRGVGVVRITDTLNRNRVTYIEDIGGYYGVSELILDPSYVEILDQKLMLILRDSLGRFRGTPARTFETLLARRIPGAFPELLQMQEDYPGLLELAWSCYKGGVWETEYVGYKEQIDFFDQNGSYGASLAQLPSCHPEDCNWVRDRSYHPGAFYGFLRVRGTVVARGLSLVALRLFEGFAAKVHLNGEFDNYFLTKQEYDLAVNLGMAKWEILEAWWGYPKHRLFPFESVISGLYEKRKTVPNLFKIIAAQGSGKLAQHSPYPGRLFNPIYASMMTALTRVKVYELLSRQRRGSRAERLDAGYSQGVVLGKEEGSQLSKFKKALLRDRVTVNAVMTLPREIVEEALAFGGQISTPAHRSLLSAINRGRMMSVGKRMTQVRTLVPNAGGRLFLGQRPSLKDLLTSSEETEIADNRSSLAVDDLLSSMEVLGADWA